MGVVSTLKHSKLFRAVLKLTSASAVSQLIMLLAMPYLTRLYDPEAFGVFAVFSALMSVVLVVSSLRYEFAIPLPKSRVNAGNLLFLALLINFLIALLTAVLVFYFKDTFAELTSTPQVGELLWLLPIAVLTGGTYKALIYWSLRKKQFGRISQTKILQSCSNVVTQIIGGIFAAGPLGLAIGQVIGQSAGTSSLFRGIRLRELLTQGASRRTVVLFRRYRNFATYDTPAAAINTISTQLPNVALALMFGPVIAGYYYLAERILWVPLSMVAQAIGQVLFSQLREELEKGTVLKVVLRILFILAGMAGAIFLPVYFFSELFFSVVFGDDWESAGRFTSILVAGIVMQFIYSPLSMVFLATNSQKTNLVVHSVILIMKVLAFYIAGVQNAPQLAIQLLSLTLFLGYGLGILLVIDRSRKSSVVQSI